ncbi:MAG: TIGR00645 family protein [Alphaproteobacteria bacterium]|nr:TIGR00645 family protein [Alphaproteobacteria bacterium]
MDQKVEPTPIADPEDKQPLIERSIEQAIFASRWLMAPIYIGLIVCLGILIVTFFRELVTALPSVMTLDETDVILLILTLVDLSLAGNLVLIILFSGYENFVSKIDAAQGAKDRPEWMGTLDFSGLKIKLIASIVAISGIHLLKVFMDVDKYTQAQLMWFTIIHLTFVASGVAFALMDFIESKAHKAK